MEDENKEFVFEIRSRVKSVHIIPDFPRNGFLQVKMYDEYGNEIFSTDYVDSFASLAPSLTDAMVFGENQPVINVDFVGTVACKLVDEYENGSILRKVICDREF